MKTIKDLALTFAYSVVIAAGMTVGMAAISAILEVIK